MKVLIFAHVPPPHHGQSYAVQLLLNGLGGNRRNNPSGPNPTPFQIDCYHVNARLSQTHADIGKIRPQKFLVVLGRSLEAIWCRFRFGVRVFYYVPAPRKRAAVYRDFIVLTLCRPFFKHLVLHWHAAGLGEWLDEPAQRRLRGMAARIYSNAASSVVLSEFNRSDATRFSPRHIRIVHNGIPDPCPDFLEHVLPRRRTRLVARRQLLQGKEPVPTAATETGADPNRFGILFLGNCTHQKGLFDAIQAVVLLNDRLAHEKSSVRGHLTVAGEFAEPAERAEFDRIAREHSFLEYAGFVSGEAKRRLLSESDCLCFPTFYEAESFGLVLIEAMAFGLSIVTTRWRSIPELFPPSFSGLVEIHSPAQIAEALFTSLTIEDSQAMRERFINNFTLEKFLKGMAAAFHESELPVK